MPCRTPNKNRYLAVENPLKKAILATLGAPTDIKAVESGRNQFVFRVYLDQYYRPKTLTGRYMAVLSVGVSLSASLWPVA